MRTYDELIRFPTFEERVKYCQTGNFVGHDTLGYDRYLSQIFYSSKEWKDIRRFVIARDDGCDLACLDRPVDTRVVIHHLNPLSAEDFKKRTKYLLDPKYLITTCHETHEAIHYSSASILVPSILVERKPNDTIPWR